MNVLIDFHENDNEFDLIASSDPEPKVRAPTVFAKHPHSASAPTRPEQHAPVAGEEVAEFEDSRLASFKEMGFSTEQAMNALAACNDDVNEALSMLLSGTK